MHKKEFIQRLMIRILPTAENYSTNLSKGEQLWAWLSQSGYGDAKQAKPRDSKNWYAEMTIFQREWFDRFWHAFGYKSGRNRAAKSWINLGALTVEKYQHIVDAAVIENAKPRTPQQIRAMAELWLNEMRFEDHITEVIQKKTNQPSKKDRLNADLNHLQMMLKRDPNNVALKQQVKDLEDDLAS